VQELAHSQGGCNSRHALKGLGRDDFNGLYLYRGQQSMLGFWILSGAPEEMDF